MAFRQLPILVSGQIVECLGDLLGGNVSVEIYGCRRFTLSVLSGDDDDAICSTSTINGRGRAVLKHINLLDIIRRNLGKRARHTVNEHKRRRPGLEGSGSTKGDLSAGDRVPVRCVHNKSRNLALDKFGRVRPRSLQEISTLDR